eukprot:5083825-Prymnesium_polylepis.1
MPSAHHHIKCGRRIGRIPTTRAPLVGASEGADENTQQSTPPMQNVGLLVNRPVNALGNSPSAHPWLPSEGRCDVSVHMSGFSEESSF